MSKRTNRQDDRRKARRAFKTTDWPRGNAATGVRFGYGEGISRSKLVADRANARRNAEGGADGEETAR